MTEAVNHPAHYNQFRHEVIELAELLNFNNGCVVKYLCRAPFKGRFDEDLRKATWYLRREQERGVDEIWSEEALQLQIDFCADLAKAGYPRLADALTALSRHEYTKAAVLLMRKDNGE